jgi:hypothetical protein
MRKKCDKCKTANVFSCSHTNGWVEHGIKSTGTDKYSYNAQAIRSSQLDARILATISETVYEPINRKFTNTSGAAQIEPVIVKIANKMLLSNERKPVQLKSNDETDVFLHQQKQRQQREVLPYIEQREINDTSKRLSNDYTRIKMNPIHLDSVMFDMKPDDYESIEKRITGRNKKPDDNQVISMTSKATQTLVQQSDTDPKRLDTNEKARLVKEKPISGKIKLKNYATSSLIEIITEPMDCTIL